MNSESKLSFCMELFQGHWNSARENVLSSPACFAKSNEPSIRKGNDDANVSKDSYIRGLRCDNNLGSDGYRDGIWNPPKQYAEHFSCNLYLCWCRANGTRTTALQQIGAKTPIRKNRMGSFLTITFSLVRKYKAPFRCLRAFATERCFVFSLHVERCELRV
jgi:hypothetical protein